MMSITVTRSGDGAPEWQGLKTKPATGSQAGTPTEWE